MPDVQNVFRRGGAYWWRRTLRWVDARAKPITLAISLGTKDLAVARHRAAAMTAKSEVVRMSLYERVAREGLTREQRDTVFRSEMRAYRDALDHLSASWHLSPAWAAVTDVDADIGVFEAIWTAFDRTGVPDGKPSAAYMNEQMQCLTDEQRARARQLLGALDLRESVTKRYSMRRKLCPLTVTKRWRPHQIGDCDSYRPPPRPESPGRSALSAAPGRALVRSLSRAIVINALMIVVDPPQPTMPPFQVLFDERIAQLPC